MAGYVRQSSSNIQPGEIVKSGPVNNEFNAIRDAFNKTSGHKHDNTTAEGAYVPLIADSDGLNKVVIDTSNNRIGFFSEVSSAAVEQVRIQDGAIVPVTDNDIDLGTSSLEFKDLFIDGTATIDTLTVDENATITANLTVNGNTTLGNAASDTVTLTADVASAITPSADDTHDLGAVGSEWRNLYVDGQALIDDLVADTADINGGNIDATVIGASTAAAGTFTDLTSTGTMTIASVDINGGAIDGVTIGANSAGAGTFTTVTASGAVVINGGLTMDTNKFTVADTSGNTAIAGTLDVTGQTTVANFTATGTTVLPATSFGDANITNVGDIALDSISADGSTITITGNTTFADGSYNFDIASHDGTNGLALGGTVVTASAAELNILDGVTATTAEINILDGDTSATSTTVADADRVVLNDNGTMVQVAVTDLAAYFDDEITAMPNLVTTAATTVGALNSGSITSGFGTIDTGSSTITTTGNITGGNLIISDGGNIGSSSDTDAISIASSGNVTMTQDLTVTGNLTVNGSTSTISSTNTTIEDALIELGTGTTGTPSNDAGIVIERGSADNAFIGYDESEDKFIVGTGSFTGASTGNLTITTGTLVANVEGNVTGNVSGSSGSTTGNAATATALQSSVNIGGVSFDGTASINLPGVNTTGDQDTTGNAAGLTSMNTTVTELNVMDGDTSATSTTLADADRVVVNDAGTMKQVALTDFETYFEGALDTLSNVTTVGALNSGSITSGFGAIDNGSSNITTSGTIQFGSLSDGTVTVTDIADEDNFSSNSATKLATQQSIKAYVDSTAGQANNVTGLTATGTELNTVADASGVSIDTSTAVAANDALLLYDNSGSSIGYFDVDLLDTYFSATTKTLTNKTLTSPTVSGLYLSDAGLTIEGSSANDFETVLNVTDPTADRTITLPDATGTVVTTGNLSAITSTGTLTTLTVDDITINGSTISDAGDLDFDIGGDLNIDVDGGDVRLKDGGTQFASLYKSGNNFGIYNPISDGDLLFQGKDGSSFFTALTVDMSAAGAATFNSDVIIPDKIVHSGDTNTAIRFPAADTVTVETGGSERMRISSGGVVAIGNSSPKTWSSNSQGVLQIGNTGAIELYNTTDDPFAILSNLYRGTDFNYKYIENNEAARISFYEGNIFFATAPTGTADTTATVTTRLKIENGGNVGIGTDSPQATIHVHDSATSSNNLQLSNAATGATSSDGIVIGMSSANAYFFNRENTDLRFGTNNTERMRIDSSGVVNVGTASGTQPSYFNSFLNVQNNGSTGSHASITITSGSGGYAGLHFGDSDNGRIGQVAYNNSDNSLLFTANNSERMRIDSSGNVLVGTTSTSLATTSSETGAMITDGSFQAAANNPVAQFNRITTDGNQITLRKDGSVVGGIGVKNDRPFFINPTNFGIRLANNALVPTDESGTNETSASDLGASDVKWKDLYLSANVYANALIHDNDTNTKIEFPAGDEMELHTGGTARLTINNSDVIIQSALKEDYDALSGTTPTIDVDAGGGFSLTMSGNTTFTFSSCTSGVITGFVLQLTGNGGTVTYPNTVDWAGGTAPDAPANGETDILVFITRDGGTNWYGALSIDAAA